MGNSFSAHHIMCHNEAIQALISANGNNPLDHIQYINFEIDIDPNFTMRDDFGNKGISEGIEIAEYIHHDLGFQAATKQSLFYI
jgi:hypothetical protein